MDILQPDICNAGGITELKKIAGMAEAQHIMMAPHNTNSAVGTVASMHLDAAMPNFLIQEYHAEFYEPHYFEVVEGLPRQEDGYVDLPKGPGLGLTIDEDLMNSHPLLPAIQSVTTGPGLKAQGSQDQITRDSCQKVEGCSRRICRNRHRRQW